MGLLVDVEVLREMRGSEVGLASWEGLAEGLELDVGNMEAKEAAERIFRWLEEQMAREKGGLRGNIITEC